MFSGSFLRSRVDVNMGKFAKVAVNHEVVQLLPEKGTCTDDYGEYGDFDTCLFDRMTKIMNKEVGCTVPWVQDKSNICKNQEDADKAFYQYQKHRRNQKDICPRPCHFTNMYFSPQVTGDTGVPDRAEAYFYFRRDIKTTREYFLYSLLSMAAEIGAYVGLLLGASLVNLVKVNSYIIDRWFANKKQTSDEYRNRPKVISVSPANQVQHK